MMPKTDPLSRFTTDLKSKSPEIRAKAAQTLRIYVEGESREKSSDSFTRFMTELNRLILELVNSSNLEEKMGGIMVIDEFIDIPYEENETKIIRFETCFLVFKCLGLRIICGWYFNNRFRIRMRVF